MTEYTIRFAEPADAPAWLSIAREVEHLFGPMADVPEFQNALFGAFDAQAALCLAGKSGAIVGGVVISTQENSIEWLAVSRSARGAGLGRKLMRAALERLDPERPVRVQTFDASCPDGEAARRLYLACGFRDVEAMAPTPAGIATVLMERPSRAAALPC